MKFSYFAIAAMLALASFSCSSSTDSEGDTPFSYQVYDRYSYHGPRAQSDSTFFYWTTTRAEFDSLFFFIYTRPNPDTIPKVDLASKKVLAVVKYGNDVYDMSVDTVTCSKRTLEMHYTCTMTDENIGSTLAQSLLIVTDANFEKVRFFENGAETCILIP